MFNREPQIGREVWQTYSDYEGQITRRHLRVGCLLVMALMPLGVLLDYFVYPGKLGYFLALRLACSVLEGAVWLLLGTTLSRKINQVLGLVVALLPVFFICWMVCVTDGAASPYYAGLNLILLAIAFVLRWSVGLSLLALVLFIAMYLGGCFLHGALPPGERGVFFNNLYFLGLTGIIVVTGSRIHRVLRVREFTLRFELDKSRKMLEESNQKLMELDQIKSRFFANISHELRTPLTLLLAPLESLLRRFNLEPDTKDLLVTMHSNGMRLLKLIDRKSTRLNSSHLGISYAVFCLVLQSYWKRSRLNYTSLRLSTDWFRFGTYYHKDPAGVWHYVATRWLSYFSYLFFFFFKTAPPPYPPPLPPPPPPSL